MSVVHQTYSDWELIVVDDGSTDGSFQVIEALVHDDPRVKLIERNRLPKGAPTCRNIGAEMATGDYLIFLDSDDVLAEFCLEQRVKVINEYPDLDFWVFSILLFHNEKDDMNILWNIDTGEDDLIRFLRLDAVWQTSSPIYRKGYFQHTKGFDETLPFWQDFELHTRLLIQNPNYRKFLKCNPDVFCRRHESSSISQIPLFAEKQLEKKLQVSISLLEALFRHQRSDKYKQTLKYTIFNILENIISRYPENANNYLGFWDKLYHREVSSKTESFFVKSYFRILKYSKTWTLFYLFKVAYRKLIPQKFKRRKTTLCRVHLDGVKNYEK